LERQIDYGAQNSADSTLVQNKNKVKGPLAVGRLALDTVALRRRACRQVAGVASALDRKIIGRDIAMCEFGWPIGMPVSRAIGRKGLREVRSTIRSGKVEARVIFGIDGADMILVHGHEKNPSRQRLDIATAEAR